MPTAEPADPVVSVVITTYNRSRVLRHAIQSVVDSSFSQWELLVIGDACTDDTAGCVASFRDARIRFVNLPVRCGDQSGPSDHGISLARGRYVAFLNHDDLHLPEHLESCVRELDRGKADFVWTACAAAYAHGDLPAGRPCRFELTGIPPRGRYSPIAFYCASSWMFRRELAGRVGRWPKPAETFVSPSQQWLFRAWRSGAVLQFVPRVTAVLIPAGVRPGSYRRPDSPDHEWFASWRQREPRWRELMLEEAAVQEVARHQALMYDAPFGAAKRLLLGRLHAMLGGCGVHPHAMASLLRHGWRGAGIRGHARLTGADSV